MNKQEYIKPAVWVVRVQEKYDLLGASGGDQVYGTTMSGEDQLSRQSDWDDWDDWEDE